MIRVGLGRGSKHYAGLAPPWDPSVAYPELARGRECILSESNNLVFSAVRDSLLSLELDKENIGSPNWNPLRSLVSEGGTVVLKPNFIRHWNPASDETARASTDSVITHGSVVRAAAEYAFLAVGNTGRVILAEAPQHDCDFAVIEELTGLRSIQDHFRRNLDLELEVIDLRREKVLFENGVIVSRESLKGDPRGYRAVDLGAKSFFTDSGLDPKRFRGADYDPGPTAEQHSNGKNAYLLSETVLSADLIINLPKLKTHKKTGVTLALKNMVGINGDKNWLPHHCAGSIDRGGDEFPGRLFKDRARSWLVELSRPFLMRGRATRLARHYRKLEIATRGDDFIRSGNWHGNRTTWRMCADLNRCVYYSDERGPHLDRTLPVRAVLTILDGIVAGEGNGPLAPLDVPLGVILASLDPIALDLAAIRLMGFDENRIAKVREVMRSRTLPVTEVKNSSDVEIAEPKQEKGPGSLQLYALDDLVIEKFFVPHPGWLGNIERTQDGSMPKTSTSNGVSV